MSEGEHSVLVVEDHPVVQDAILSAMRSLNVFRNIQSADTLASALAILRDLPLPNLVILDLQLKDSKGIVTLTAIREYLPDLPVIVFSAEDESNMMIDVYEHGALGFVAKSAPLHELILAVQTVLQGNVYLPAAAGNLLGISSPTPAPLAHEGWVKSPLETLTPRQRQVLDLLLQGLSNKLIARELEMAEGTVKTHLNTVYRVFRVNSRTQLLLEAVDLGLVK